MTRWGGIVAVALVVAAAVWLADDEADGGRVETVVPPDVREVRPAPEPVRVDVAEEPAALDVPAPTPDATPAERLPDEDDPTRARPLEVFDATHGGRIVEGTILAHPGDQAEELELAPVGGKRLDRDAFTTALVDGRLPDTLDIPFDDVLLWFGAEGYAWRWVLVTGEPGTPLRVGLRTGTRVLVECDDALESLRYGTTLVVRPRASAARPWLVRLEWPTTDLGTLDPGAYDVELRTAAEFEAGRVHAAASFEVYGESERVVRLDASERPPGAALVVEHTTDAPLERRDRIRLERYGDDGALLAPAGENRGQSWPLQGRSTTVTYDDLEPGRYRITVGWLGRPRDVELRSGETAHVVVEHEASAEVAIVGTPNASVYGHYADNGEFLRAHRLDDEGQATLKLLPDHRLTLQAFAGGTSSRPVTVTPRAHDAIDVQLPCLPGRPTKIEVLVTFHDLGWTLASTPFGAFTDRFDVQPIGHDGRVVSHEDHPARLDGARLTLIVSEPGPYRITISPPYELPQTFTRSPGGGLDDAIEVAWSP